MNWTELTFHLFDLLGTISFALSGAMVAVKKQADLFGVLFLGILTAVGGGVVRDVLLGQFPPRSFVNSLYVSIAALSALALFLLVRLWQDWYLEREGTVDAVNNIFDALGLGMFTVTGVQTAFSAGQGNNVFFAVFLGAVTGIGGGLMRDVTVGEIPFVLKKRIYAVASIAGGLAYCLLVSWGLSVTWCSIISMALVFGIRMLATIFKWHLPKALKL